MQNNFHLKGRENFYLILQTYILLFMKVIKIGASWCAGCRVMKPRWEEIEKENPWLETEFISLDDHPEATKE